jgi:hypothetical protein
MPLVELVDVVDAAARLAPVAVVMPFLLADRRS